MLQFKVINASLIETNRWAFDPKVPAWTAVATLEILQIIKTPMMTRICFVSWISSLLNLLGFGMLCLPMAFSKALFAFRICKWIYSSIDIQTGHFSFQPQIWQPRYFNSQLQKKIWTAQPMFFIFFKHDHPYLQIPKIKIHSLPRRP